MIYMLAVLTFSLYMIYRVAPKYGAKSPIVYISICSVVGSVSVMAIKGFGVALKLTFAGNNQLSHPSTYLFGLVVAGCIVVQMNYFNKVRCYFVCSVMRRSMCTTGPGPILYKCRQPYLLCLLLVGDNICLLHSLPRLQYFRRSQHDLADSGVHYYLPWRLPLERARSSLVERLLSRPSRASAFLA